jgi:hypothetical protein
MQAELAADERERVAVDHPEGGAAGMLRKTAAPVL